MDAEAALAWVDTLVFAKTGERLSALQKTIIQQVWQGRKYLEIAEYYGYTEGHIKDVGSQLWKLLSKESRGILAASSDSSRGDRAVANKRRMGSRSPQSSRILDTKHSNR